MTTYSLGVNCITILAAMDAVRMDLVSSEGSDTDTKMIRLI